MLSPDVDIEYSPHSQHTMLDYARVNKTVASDANETAKLATDGRKHLKLPGL